MAIHRYTKRTAVVLATLVFFGATLTAVDRALAAPNTTQQQSQALANGERILTIHDRGEERVVITKARTLRTALKSADVHVTIGHDVVEPALDTELTAATYSVNIYRARPVTVVDGLLRQRVTTAEQTPEGIAKAAGVTLHKEDETDVQMTNDLLLDGAAVAMTIQRATPIALKLYGAESTVRTQAKTVGEFLKEKNIVMNAENDRASHAMDAPIEQGMQLRIWREGKQTVTEEKEIDFPTEIVRDADKPTDFKEVRTPGEKGKRNVTYEILIQDEQEVERKEIASVTTKEPVKQVEVRGSKAASMQYTGGGSKTDWLRASGIPESEWGYVDFIVGRESGWNPNATNPSSGACGLAQALPCSKIGGAGGYDPVTALRWQHQYVTSRYGGYAQAYAFWSANHWY